jgi:hypothetical protein
MDEREPERVVVEETPTRVERETTVVATGDRGGGGGAIAALVLLVVLGLLAFLYFGGYLGQAADETNLNVNVEAPDVELPDVDLPAAPGNSS